MKIRIELTVDVDADTWAMEYGIERRDVRRDFRAAAEAAIYELAGSSQAEDDSPAIEEDPMDHFRTTDDRDPRRDDDAAWFVEVDN